MAGDRAEPSCAVPMPESLSAQLSGYRWVRDSVGQSGGAVFRLHGKPGTPDLFLKYGSEFVAKDIGDEFVRLRWLAGYVPVPTVRQFIETDGQAWLLMTALPGETAHQALIARPDQRPAIVDTLAKFLTSLHAIPASECPFTSNHAHRLALARTRIDAGLVEEDDFDDEREGWSAEEVWQALQQHLPFAPDPVVTHGDFSLDNILIHNGEVAGCIDTARTGIADRYQDVAILWNSLGEFGPLLQQRLLTEYGVAAPDSRKLQFHLMLDELF